MTFNTWVCLHVCFVQGQARGPPACCSARQSITWSSFRQNNDAVETAGCMAYPAAVCQASASEGRDKSRAPLGVRSEPCICCLETGLPAASQAGMTVLCTWAARLRHACHARNGR